MLPTQIVKDPGSSQEGIAFPPRLLFALPASPLSPPLGATMDYILRRTPGNRGENSFRRAVLRDELSSDHSRSRPASQGNPARNQRYQIAALSYLASTQPRLNRSGWRIDKNDTLAKRKQLAALNFLENFFGQSWRIRN